MKRKKSSIVILIFVKFPDFPIPHRHGSSPKSEGIGGSRLRGSSGRVFCYTDRRYFYFVIQFRGLGRPYL